MALMNHSIIEGQPDYTNHDVAPFCLPATTTVSVENLRPLIPPFLRYVEANADMLRGVDGTTAFLDAMRSQWPCRHRS